MNLNLKLKAFKVLLFSLFFCGVTMNSSFIQKSQVSRPNILIILVDDAGYADFGFMGCKDLETPNLDKLALQGVRFTDAHVTASVCSPSRAGLLTGKYQQRFGYECNEGEGYTGLETSQILISQALKNNGYSTAAFGKWHLGFQPAQHPLNKGFDYYYGFLSGGRSYFYKPDKDDRAASKNAMLENDKPIAFDGYLTDALGDKTVEYIRKNKNNPFFIYWAPNAVHTPMEATKEDLEKYKNHPRQKLAAMTFALDRAVGKIIDELKRQNLFENTLIFFLSDNGGAYNNQSSNLPLKGFKGNKYEGGHRIPFIVSWPKIIGPQNNFAGITSSLDIFPTILEAAGIPKKSVYRSDGVSLLPFLKGNGKKDPHQELVWRKDKAAAIRSGQYKLIQIQGAGDRLYNLNADPGETKDIQVEAPKIYSRLKEKLAKWEKNKMKPIWTEGNDWDTITLMIHDDLMNNRKVRVTSLEELNKFREKK